jgi:hypothetical protein
LESGLNHGKKLLAKSSFRNSQQTSKYNFQPQKLLTASRIFAF